MMTKPLVAGPIQYSILYQKNVKSQGRTGKFGEIGASKSQIYEISTPTEVIQIFRCCWTAITESTEVDIIKTISLPINSFYRVHCFLVMYYDLWLIVTSIMFSKM